MELGPREEAILLALIEGSKGVNELFKILREQGLVSDKRQVTRSVSRLEELGLVERRGKGKGQKIEIRLTPIGELAVTLKETTKTLRGLRRKLKIYENIDAETLSEMLSFLEIELDRERLEWLAEQVKKSIRQGVKCESIVDVYLTGLAMAGFLYGYLRNKGSPLAEWVGEQMAEIVAVVEAFDCLETVRKRLDELSESLADVFKRSILSVVSGQIEASIRKKANIDGE